MPKPVYFPLKNQYIIGDKLFFAIVRKLIESQDYGYTEDIHYTSAISDSMVLQICEGDKKLTITRHGSNDDEIKIHGEGEFVRQFMHDMAIEATTLIFGELCSSFFKCGKNELEHSIHEKIKLTIDSVFAEKV